MTEIKPFKGKVIYTTKGSAREYGRVGCNFYRGCPHECEYCYLRYGPPAKQLGGNVATLKNSFKDEEKARQVFVREAIRHLDVIRKTGLFFSFSTDPMHPDTRDLTLFGAVWANHHGIPVKILTKNADFIHDQKVMRYICSPTLLREQTSFGFTLTGRDDMEPKASPNFERIEAMRCLHNLGFKTFASIEPVIDWHRSVMVVNLSLDCCDHYMIGLRSGVKKGYYDLVGSGLSILGLTERIVNAGRTVYLKESTRELLRRCFIEGECERILGMTLDMDGQPYQKVNHEDGKQ